VNKLTNPYYEFYIIQKKPFITSLYEGLRGSHL